MAPAPAFRPEQVEHIGIAVPSLAEAKALYERSWGLACVHEEDVPAQKVRVAFYRVGATLLELLEPTDPAGPVGRYLERRGPGVHHVAYGVADIGASLTAAKAAGFELVDAAPRTGARGHLVAFLHPRSTGGVLTELVQEGPG